MVGPQSMVKWGGASLSAEGRLSQIWNSSRGLAASCSSSGNISAWTMPLPAGQPLDVTAAVPRGSSQGIGMVDEAAADHRHRLESAMGVLREAGHDVAVVHPPAVPSGEVVSQISPGQGRGGAPSPRCPAGRHRRGERRRETGLAPPTGSPGAPCPERDHHSLSRRLRVAGSGFTRRPASAAGGPGSRSRPANR